MGARLESIAGGRYFPWFAALLVAIRFATPSVSASLGVQGYDTAVLDAFSQVYAALLPGVATVLVAVLLVTWPGAVGRDRWLQLALVFVALSVIFWAGEADSAYRMVWGPWATLPLALSATAAILAYGAAMEVRLRPAMTETIASDALRALYGGFGFAYLLGSLRYIDYRSAVGTPLPSGWLWFLNNGPTLILCSVSVVFWMRLTLRRASNVAGAVQSLALPLLGVLVGFAVSQGLGGFILSNVLAWGGAYEVFVPTAVSLAVVGFAVGSFLATAWALRRRLSDPTWRLVVGGVSTTAFAGILFFDGAAASLAGILLGVTCVARGLSGRGSLHDVDLDRRPHATPIEYRE